MALKFLLLFLLFAHAVGAQSTQADIEARLVHKPLYLRGLWRGDKLKFDAAGALVGSSKQVPFTVAGMDVNRIELKSDRLTVEGRRIGVMFSANVPQRVFLQTGGRDSKDEVIHMEIEAPPSGDYTAAMDAVFSSLASLAPTLPLCWRRWLVDQHLMPAAVADATTLPAATPLAKTPDNTPTARRVGGGVTAPKVLFAPEPQFTSYARALKWGGKCLVYLQVDREGTPDEIAILRPIGLGLDEQAVEAVGRYRFVPATENGEGVRVEMNVEVNFQIF